MKKLREIDLRKKNPQDSINEIVLAAADLLEAAINSRDEPQAILLINDHDGKVTPIWLSAVCPGDKK